MEKEKIDIQAFTYTVPKTQKLKLAKEMIKNLNYCQLGQYCPKIRLKVTEK